MTKIKEETALEICVEISDTARKVGADTDYITATASRLRWARVKLHLASGSTFTGALIS